MRYSRYLMPTTKETPSDAEVVSHRLMLRAGLLRKVASGIYNYMPAGLRVLRKVERILREEMDRAGAQEVLMPAVVPSELWKESGRWDAYGKELLRFKDRADREFCLGPTHEEVITDLVRREVRSYRQLPLTLYQIQDKFRDEIRPRFGLMRGREFFMKDAYSFDADEDGAAESYRKMYGAYCRIFRRMGLDFRAVEADTGNIGGSSSHEFMVIADSGEDAIVSCSSCAYGANVEKAECSPAEAATSPMGTGTAKEGAPRKVSTPGRRTIEEVSAFLAIDPATLIKTLLFETSVGDVAVLVSGPHEVNEVKVRNRLGAEWVRLAGEERVRELTGAPSGFAGPVGLSVRTIADHSVRGIRSGATGANEKDAHLVDVVPGRDFAPEEYVDLRMVRDGDACPRCGAPLRFSRGIEVGHVFRLGTKYSEAMRAVYLDESGKERVSVMGCYGIGVGRTAAAAIEQNHDDDGIVWPISIAPFEVAVIPVNVKHADLASAAERIAAELDTRGVEVFLDDREERPGIKFKDADLTGIPVRITLGEKNVAAGFGEIRDRKTGETLRIPLAELANAAIALVERKKAECAP
ncbi:MAG: proline--tRNA ligase [Deltaproteobacteria bacterium RBG_16_66_15]|nr:MAG: proline--tRNA ligase [Deltaproteobacteria bacterium GWA2_65_63]OGP26931.1 MAG: proline--tRNA ligase [Deltaproteobacteria bacterium GWB2_65_81]OGP38733.1 MAG: proline--tRNA ligase [Deltaproteobacteria bacterium GWC2_66_88]OGP77910.1 MAG: proline--tRNA ligase [Deltaproteobacteria bacterium RBG_16_66_15]HAM33479.1 proline--tRNA ligase [Deltaproteobacteria bacterium]